MFTATAEHESPSIVRRARPRSEADEVGYVGAGPGRHELLAIANGLLPIARQWPGMTGRGERRWELMVATDTFEAWVIGWPPGGTISLHDHGASAGAVAVADGALLETVVAENLDGTASSASRTMEVGSSWGIARGEVHDVVNHGSTPALSVHVYAPRLTSMTHYRLEDGALRPEQTVYYRLGAIEP